VLLLGCSGESQPDPPDTGGTAGSECPSDLPTSAACAAAPSYQLDAAPVIDRRCNVCHYAGNSQSQDVFETYEGVFAQRQTVLSRVYGCVMPPRDAPALSPEERAVLLEWLVCGAPED
jgi:hypothetical protein